MQHRVAQGNPPQALFDGVLPKRDSRRSIHGGRPNNLAHGREHHGFSGTRRPRSSISGGLGPSSSGCLRHAAESRFRRQHIRNGHLAIARHLLSSGERERDAKQRRKKKKMWDLGTRRLLFYRPVSLCGSYDFMTGRLMGADFVRTKHVPVHTETKKQRKRKPVFLFSLTQGLQEDLLQGKRWVPSGPRTP